MFIIPATRHVRSKNGILGVERFKRLFEPGWQIPNLSLFLSINWLVPSFNYLFAQHFLTHTSKLLKTSSRVVPQPNLAIKYSNEWRIQYYVRYICINIKKKMENYNVSDFIYIYITIIILPILNTIYAFAIYENYCKAE